MKINEYSEMIFSQADVFDQIMQGQSGEIFDGMLVDEEIDLSGVQDMLSTMPRFQLFSPRNINVNDWHKRNQSNWRMPQEYHDLDIAKWLLDQCQTQEELQRVGEELLMYQEHDLLDLLKYLKYLVDLMREHHVIWGVGRGSSVASYVLYLIGVHRINSMYYDLDVKEFLRK
jgi:DNA polymerase III alpha subunit